MRSFKRFRFDAPGFGLVATLALASPALAQDGGAVAADDSSSDDSGATDAKAEFCTDLADSSGGDTPVDDVAHSGDLAEAAAADAPDDVAPALQTMADFAHGVASNDDDGTVTDEETQAAVADNADIVDAIGTAQTYCEDTSRATPEGG